MKFLPDEELEKIWQNNAKDMRFKELRLVIRQAVMANELLMTLNLLAHSVPSKHEGEYMRGIASAAVIKATL